MSSNLQVEAHQEAILVVVMLEALEVLVKNQQHFLPLLSRNKTQGPRLWGRQGASPKDKIVYIDSFD
jgi:hypothetical protein